MSSGCDKSTEVGRILLSYESFGKKLFASLSSNRRFVLSPFHVHTVLTMVLAGSAEETARQLRCVLGIADLALNCDVALEIIKNLRQVNPTTLDKIYLQSGHVVEPRFDRIVSKLQSEIEQLNFEDAAESARIINDRISKKTDGKINRIITSGQLNRTTRMLPLTAAYFKPNWGKGFDKNLTRRETFYPSTGPPREVQMMHDEQTCNYANDRDLKASILEIPCERDEFSVLIFLPDERNGIDHLKTDVVGLNLSNLRMNKTQVSIALPKFRLESELLLADALMQIGLTLIFCSGADFREIYKTSDLLVNNVIQKVLIEVDEDGVEPNEKADAGRNSKENVDFVADHDFLFVVKYVDVILYIGVFSC